MAKFDNTMFAALWSEEGRRIQTMILEDPNRVRQYFDFWRTKFSLDPVMTPTNPDGTAAFTSTMRELKAGVMMDMRAPLADGKPMEKGGAKSYTGTIPNFIGRTFIEKATEREYKENMFAQMGIGIADQALASYTMNFLQENMNGANMTLSHMAATLLSKGYVVYNQGEGIQAAIYKADIPTKNFLNAGAYVWSDIEHFKFLDWGVAMVEELNSQFGVDINWQLEITKADFKNYIMKNAQVLAQVRYVNNINGLAMPATAQVTRDMVLEAINKWDGMPQISIIEEKQNDITNGVVNGWAENTVVMRPVGLAGMIRHTSNLDAAMASKYGNDVISAVYTQALNGLLTIENAVVPNGRYKEWQARAMMQAIPSLDEFLAHFIIKTNQANSDTTIVVSKPLNA